MLSSRLIDMWENDAQHGCSLSPEVLLDIIADWKILIKVYNAAKNRVYPGRTNEPLSVLDLRLQQAIRKAEGEETAREITDVDADVQKVWEDFWKPIVCPNGFLSIDQVKKELFDFKTIMRNMSKVYDHATGGCISYLTTDAKVVIAEIDKNYKEKYEELYRDEKENETDSTINKENQGDTKKG